MDLIAEGQKLNLCFPKESKIVEIACTIENVYDNRLYVTLPKYFMRYIEYLETGCALTAKVFSKIGTIDFNTIVISSPLEDNFTIEFDCNAIKFTPSSEIPEINPIDVIQINDGKTIVSHKTFALSVDYVKFYSDKVYEQGKFIEGSLILPAEYGIIKFRAVISEIDPVYKNEIKALFTVMSEPDRQTLLYYMYMYSMSTDQE